MRKILLPFSALWWLLVSLRNFFYDKGWLKTFEFDFPVILTGNLSTGGTGKTPHVLYLMKLLLPRYKIATLSRGYKRKTKGYILSTELSLVEDIGDESKLFKQKYPSAEVAVSADRVAGVYGLLLDEPDIKVILMDDGFQHRRITAGFRILLTAQNDLYTNDFLLPAGNLRDPAKEAKRAHVIIVTKCNPGLSETEANQITKKLRIKKQSVFFTAIEYLPLQPLFPEQEMHTPGKEIISVSGIAGSSGFTQELEKNYDVQHKIKFSDHHYFSDEDLDKIDRNASGKAILTTEKDAMRLMEKKQEILDHKLSFFVLPVGIKFLFAGGQAFDRMIFDYIGKYADHSA